MYAIAFIIVFVLAFGLSAYETVFSLFSDHKFGFTPKDIAAIITISSIFGVVVQVFMFGKLVDIFGEKVVNSNMFNCRCSVSICFHYSL